jgi:hypothetical protein
MKNDWQVGAVYVVSTRSLHLTGQLVATTPGKLFFKDAIYSLGSNETQCGSLWVERGAITYAYRQIITCAYTPVQLPLHEAVTN